MRALTIQQPWASLIAFGEKRIETRGWRTKYRGPLLIHAGKSREWTRDPDEWAPHPYPFVMRRCNVYDWSTLPHGAVVAVADLIGCVDNLPSPDHLSGIRIPCFERDFGFYGDGRVGWVLDNVRALSSPVWCSGRQGLWTPPQDLLDQVDGFVVPTIPGIVNGISEKRRLLVGPDGVYC